MRQLCLLVFISILTSGCGVFIDRDVVNGESKIHDSTDPTFLTYIASFESHAKDLTQDDSFKVENVHINFGDTRQDNFDGVCVKYPNGDKEIFIKQFWWDKSSEQEKEVLIFHELGHCKLNRSHDEHVLNHTKTSLMNPVVPNESSYTQYKLQYLTELFTGNKDKLISSISI